MGRKFLAIISAKEEGIELQHTGIKQYVSRDRPKNDARPKIATQKKQLTWWKSNFIKLL